MDVTNSEISDIQIWSIYCRKITTFRNKCNLQTFNELFKEDGERLINHYIYDCDRDFIKFLTYLQIQQRNILLIYIVKLEPSNNL